MKVEDCSECGLCKGNCPIWGVAINETLGPRGKVILIKNKLLDNSYFMCTLCGACEVECPLGIELTSEIRDKRGALVSAGKGSEANERMIENIREHRNPFGKIEKGGPKELFCC